MTWHRTRLKHLAEVPITNGLGLPGEHGNPDWPRYIRTTDIAGPTSLRTDVFASQPPEVAAKAPVARGDILMTAAGATIGKSVLIKDDLSACYAGFLVRFRARATCDARYISHWMQSQSYWGQIETGAVRSTIDNFSASKYQNLELPLPPLEEQRRIADFLDDQVARIDRIIEARQRQLALSGECAEAEIESILWREADAMPLRHRVQEIVVGIVVQPASFYTDDLDGVPAVRGTDISPGRIDTADLVRITPEGHRLHPRSQLLSGDVLVVRTGQAGAAALVPDELVGANTISNVIVRPGNGLSAQFLELVINSRRAVHQIGEESVGAIQQHFGVNAMKSLAVPAIAVEDQRKRETEALAVRASTYDAAALLGSLTQALQELKRSLITAAVTGEFDVSAASGVV